MLPPLPHLDVNSTEFDEPTPKIKLEEDVIAWKQTEGFQYYALFIRRLNEAVVGQDLGSKGEQSEAITKMIHMLDEMESWISEIPPQPTPQRFGNLAFRDWGKRLEERAPTLLATLLPPHLAHHIHLFKPYLLVSFGSFIRIDYGSGHELCFALLLLCLTLTRYFNPDHPLEERHLVLRVFHRYLKLVWTLQDVYKLEPAGSHGVWGLDDYHFLSYLWGSAQVRSDPLLTPSSILRQPLPETNLYNLSISRIHALKRGPFHEHSSQLYTIASSVPNWAKVNSGLIKMYDAEVLGKRVVVQHVPLGGLLGWNIPDRERAPHRGSISPWSAGASTSMTTTTSPLPGGGSVQGSWGPGFARPP